MSDNNIESLDLVAVEQLQVLQCSRNSLTHLMIYGKNLTSLIAGNNSKFYVSFFSICLFSTFNFFLYFFFVALNLKKSLYEIKII